MRTRTQLLATAAERAMGRFMRAPDHPPADPAPAEPAAEPAAPAAEDPPAESHGEQDDFAAFEAEVDKPEDTDPPAEPKDDTSSGDDVDPATPEPDDADKGDPPAPEDQQGASVQERIDELTTFRREAERDRDEARRENEELRQRLEALEKGGKPDDKTDQKVDPKDQRPDPEAYEFGEADSKYIADLARYETRQELSQQREQEAAQAERTRVEQELQQVDTAWKERIAEDTVTSKYSDFTAKVIEGGNRGDWALSPVGTVLVKSSEVGPDVAYHLASNPDESRRIAGLSAVEQAVEIGRLEGRYLAQKEQSAKTPAKPASEAPPPPQKRSRGTGGKYAAEADTEDFGAFEKLADGVLSQQ